MRVGPKVNGKDGIERRGSRQRSPAAARARQHKAKKHSERDLVPEGHLKVAHYEVVGRVFFKSNPSRTGRSTNAGNR
jgi:hypothetical protein